MFSPLRPQFVTCPQCKTPVRVQKWGLVRKHRRQGQTCLGSYIFANDFPPAPPPLRLTKPQKVSNKNP